MRLTIGYSEIKKKRNLVLINNGAHQRKTLSEQSIRLPLILHVCFEELIVTDNTQLS